jgi:flagellar biosynthesis protein FlhG
MWSSPSSEPPREPVTAASTENAPRLIALGGGKGGVGKTFLAANLSALLARSGARVIAVDTDVEGANLHTWLGVPQPRASLADFVAGRVADPLDLVVETPTPNLGLIAGTHGNLAASQPEPSRRIELLQRLRRLPCDFVFVDCGAGAHPATIDYFLVGDDGVLVVHPEPTSLENAYSFLRAAFYRRMQLVMQKHDVRERVREAMDQRNVRGIQTPLDLLREVEAMDPEEGRRFAKSMRAFRPRIIVNEVESAEEIKLGFSVRSVCRKFFGIDADYLGYVNRDPAVREAVIARRPLVDVKPRSDASVYLQRIARKLAEAAQGRRSG